MMQTLLFHGIANNCIIIVLTNWRKQIQECILHFQRQWYSFCMAAYILTQSAIGQSLII